MVTIVPFVVLYADPEGPMFPREYPASDAVAGKAPTARAALDDTANELLSGSPNGKNLSDIHYS